MSYPHDGRMYVHHQAAASTRAALERSELVIDHATIADHEHLGATRRATHVHAVYHVVVFTRGSGSFLLHDQVVPYRAPYLVLTAPGHAHSFQGTPSENGLYSEVTFHGRDRHGRTLVQGWPDLLAGRYCCPCPLPAHGPLRAAAAQEVSLIIARIVEHGFAATSTGDALIHGYLEQLLFALFRQAVAARSPAAGDAIDQLRELLETSDSDPRQAAVLARGCGLTPKHLARAFSRRFGLPPVQYRRRWSMQQAATLIRSTQLPLREIAERLGFLDPAYFSRVFRSVHGDSPHRYRQQLTPTARPGDP